MKCFLQKVRSYLYQLGRRVGLKNRFHFLMRQHRRVALTLKRADCGRAFLVGLKLSDFQCEFIENRMHMRPLEVHALTQLIRYIINVAVAAQLTRSAKRKSDVARIAYWAASNVQMGCNSNKAAVHNVNGFHTPQESPHNS